MTHSNLTFFVAGKPATKNRMRPTEATRAWADQAGWEARQAILNDGDYQMIAKPRPVTLLLTFVLPDHRRRDLDNLKKNIGDALQGISYEDDDQIVQSHITKCFDKENPGVWVTVMPCRLSPQEGGHEAIHRPDGVAAVLLVLGDQDQIVATSKARHRVIGSRTRDGKTMLYSNGGVPYA